MSKPELACDFEQTSEEAISFYGKYGKRVLDVFVAAVGLILLLPLFGLVACLIKLTSRGPVVYRQVRIGKNGCPFQILKFRSMRTDTPVGASMIAISGDSRVTPLGRFLRRYKIDEFPQLWNVLIGNMSLVGPRPEVPAYVADYSPEQRVVLSVRPGITDLASLVYRFEEDILAGHEDPEQYYLTQILPDKLARNRTYLENMSFWSDLLIIIKTISTSFLLFEKPKRARQPT